MRPLVVALLLVLVRTAAPAAAAPVPPPPPAVDLNDDGAALVVFPGGDGLLKAYGTAAGFQAPVAASRPGQAVQFGRWWADAAGHALYVAANADYEQPDPAPGVSLFDNGPRGPADLSPILPAYVAGFDVSGDGAGELMTAWGAAAAAGVAVLVAGNEFAQVPGRIPLAPQVAQAPAGRGGLIVGEGCQDGCELEVRERLPGDRLTGFADPSPIPGSAGLKRYDVALAADGSALVAGERGGRALAFERRAGAWSAPIDLGAISEFGNVEVGVAAGGAGVVAVDGGGEHVVSELAGDGSVGTQTRSSGTVGFFGNLDGRSGTVSVRDDGAAAAVVPGAVLARAPGMPFAARPVDPANGPVSTVSIASSGLLVGTGSYGGYAASLNGATTVLGPYPYSFEGPRRDRYKQVIVPRVALRAQAGTVAVPLRCTSDGPARCVGKIELAGTERSFSLQAREGTYVRLPVGPAARRAALTVRGRAGRQAFERRIVRDPPRPACRIAQWARTLATGGESRVAVEKRPGNAGRIVACASGVPRRIVRDGGGADVAAVRGGTVAFVTEDDVLHVAGLRTRKERVRALFAEGDREALSVRIAPDGTIVLVDRVDRQLRVRVVPEGAEERIVAFSTGIEPGSLRVSDSTIRWNDGDSSQSTPLP